MMYIIDTKSDPGYFLVIDENGKVTKISKVDASLDTVKKVVGLINIKEIR